MAVVLSLIKFPFLLGSSRTHFWHFHVLGKALNFKAINGQEQNWFNIVRICTEKEIRLWIKTFWKGKFYSWGRVCISVFFNVVLMCLWKCRNWWFQCNIIWVAGLSLLYLFSGTNQQLFNDYLRKINMELSYVQFELRAFRNQYNGSVYYGVVNNVADEQSKLGTKYTVPQIAFYKGIVSFLSHYDFFMWSV